MKVFRLAKRKNARELDSRGAAKFGNRWNSKGTEIIYTAQSRALAMAEVAAHLTLATLPKNYVMIEIEVPDNIIIKNLPLNDLGNYWNNHPPNSATQKIGDDFINSANEGALKVPSAVVKGDFDYLINPHHQDFKKITIIDVTDFPFDKRIFK